jgi:hypothetical protein
MLKIYVVAAEESEFLESLTFETKPSIGVASQEQSIRPSRTAAVWLGRTFCRCPFVSSALRKSLAPMMIGSPVRRDVTQRAQPGTDRFRLL